MKRMLFIVALLAVSLAGPGFTAAQQAKPNIVLALMDNFGWGELGVYGSVPIDTPLYFPTLAHLAGGTVPTDRVIDGVDQTDFLIGKQAKSNREGLVVYVGNDIHGVKWRNWKMMSKEMDIGDGPVRGLSIPRFYNLLIDPKEEHPAMPTTPENFWIRFPVGKILTDHAASLQKEPPIRPGTPDLYMPKR